MAKNHKKKNKNFIDTGIIDFSGVKFNKREEVQKIDKKSEKKKHDTASEIQDILTDFNKSKESNISEHPRSSRKPSTDDIIEVFLDNVDVICHNGQLYIYNDDMYIPADDNKVITQMRVHLKGFEQSNISYRKLQDTVNLLRCTAEIQCNSLSVERSVILFNNGLYDLRKDKFVQSSPQKIVFNKVNASYMPDEKYETPVFDKFVENISGGNSQIKKLLLAFLGYCLLPESDAKCFFVLGTAKNSGKSILAHLLGRLVGEANVSHVAIHDFGGQFDLAPILNKALNTAMDLDSDIISKKAVSRIKNLTGGDMVEINIKHQPHYAYQNRAKFVFATNHPIILDQADSAFWDRVVYIPFLYSIPKEDQDKELIDKLFAERDGIVKKAVKAAKKLIKNNYMFPQCDVAEAILQTWRFGKDYSVGEFVKKCCIITTDANVKTYSQDLYTAYCQFCDKEDFDKVSTNQFSRIMTDVFELEPSRWASNGSRSLRGFIGISLKKRKDDDFAYIL